jgi:hypothetical protein
VGVAAIGRVGAAAFVANLGLDVKSVPADGQCLLTAVLAAAAMGGKTKGMLFTEAVAAIADETTPLAHVKALRKVYPDGATEAVQHAQSLACTRLSTCAGSSAWNAELGDCMPAALSRITGRRIVVVSGQWCDGVGSVVVHVIDEKPGGETIRGADVFLVRSGEEFGVPHYDACVPRE